MAPPVPAPVLTSDIDDRISHLVDGLSADRAQEGFSNLFQLRYTVDRLTFADTIARVFTHSARDASPIPALPAVSLTWLLTFVADDPLQTLALVLNCQALSDSRLRVPAADYLRQHLETLLNDLTRTPPVTAARQTLLTHVLSRLDIRSNPTLTMSAPSPASGPITLDAILRKEGPACLTDPDHFLNVLRNYDVADHRLPELFSEEHVALALHTMMAAPAGSLLATAKSQDDWNFNTFAQILRRLSPHLAWAKVISIFGVTDLVIPSPKAAQNLLDCYAAATQDTGAAGFPVAAVSFRWKSIPSQLKLFSVLLGRASSGHWDLTGCRPVVKPEDLEDYLVLYRGYAANLGASLWGSLDLIALCAELSGSPEYANPIKSLLGAGVDQSPELILLGFLQLDGPWSTFAQTVVVKLLTHYLGQPAGGGFVLHLAWRLSQSTVFATMLELYKVEAGAVPHLVEVAHNLRAESAILPVRQYPFVLDFALFCARRAYLDLEPWLAAQVVEGAAPSVNAILEYLRLKLALESQRQEGAPTNKALLLRPEEFALYLKAVSNAPLNNDQVAYFKAIYQTFGKFQPALLASAEDGGLGVPPEAEKAAETYYLKLYKGDVAVTMLLEHLTNLRDSVELRERQIYACVVLCLLDEFKFLPNYPDKELDLYSTFFGSLLARRLFPRPELRTALGLLGEALRSDPNGPLFRFALTVLHQLREQLCLWPAAARRLGQLPALRSSQSETAAFVRQVADRMADPEVAARIPTDPYYAAAGEAWLGADAHHAVEATRAPTGPFTTVHADALPADALADEPSEEVQDKILFIMNNVAQNNLTDKVSEMKEVLTVASYRWFSQHILVKRASNQPNYHQLYSDLLDRVDDRLLARCVLHETLVNIRVLLNSDKTVHDSTERSHLKNLGAWLGGLTLARNRPVKHTQVAFKELLLEGYAGGRLIVAIPFVCKVLEQAARSTVFRPPNPWLLAVLRVLVELYKSAELKLNLKFEIEVLCKALRLDLHEIEPSTYLAARAAGTEAGPVAATPAAAAALLPRSADPTTAATAAVGVAATDAHKAGAAGHFAYVPPTLLTPNEISTNLTHLLATHSKLTSAAALVGAHPALKRAILATMERLLRDVMPVQVARAVLIAATATSELVAKDFCMEPSEEKMRWAAHKMARGVAGTLAIAQCRKPLQDGLYGHLKEFLVAQGLADPLAEQFALGITNDNIDLACALVETEAMTRAAHEVDESLAPGLLARKRHRERTGQPFYDTATYANLTYPPHVPAELKVRPQGLLPAQLRIYEDFAAIPHFASQTASANDHTNPETSPLTARQCYDKFAQYVLELDKLVVATQINTFAELPQQHDIRLLMREILVLVIRSAARDDTALDFAQTVVQLLYKNESNLAREVFVILLDKLCGLSPKAQREVTHWLTYADDERKYSVPVTVALIKARLISVPEQDRQLAKLMEGGRAPVAEFAAHLIRKCVLDPQPCGSRADFAASVDALARLSARGRAPAGATALLEDLQRATQPPSAPTPAVADTAQYTYRTLLAEWMRLCDAPGGDKAPVAFVLHLQQRVPLADRDAHAAFFRVAFEAAVEHYTRHRTVGPAVNAAPAAAYSALDALARLTVCLVRYPASGQGAELADEPDQPAVANLRTVLGYFALLLTVDHQRRAQLFNQKPYFRFLVSLLHELRSQVARLPAVYTRLLADLAEVLRTLQPAYLPGFSFAWVSLVAHRFFLPRFLTAEVRWPLAEGLLLDGLRFIAPALGRGALDEPTRLLYKGLVRIMLVILHDFPEFLCDYYTSFCDVIPPNCVQLRNLVVSAYARDMRLPEPLSPDLRLDQLPEVQVAPRILSDYTRVLTETGTRAELDEGLAATSDEAATALADALAARFGARADPSAPGDGFPVPLINSTVLYLGVRAMADPSTAGLVVHATYERLADRLTPDVRYRFLNALANQLRHPSSHTHYFSRALLRLFTESNVEAVQEQITRVLIERAVVNRPLPWGLLVTLIELMSNPACKFWDHKFTTVAPAITHILQAVSKSITTRS
ncbi:CCR4-NOT core subunit cdc39 [Tieghemiomyces parasiticus]|uniref:General negative regulator of transcription subunit 1 n=1 Tax=Tieghemiomyces parasiticus TaxID=78921 RepID=A0A9W8E0R2_9FUNG|nr:CCR4-NOT core subunit cdc39 [Tieghemiomyces parasiticus]